MKKHIFHHKIIQKDSKRRNIMVAKNDIISYVYDNCEKNEAGKPIVTKKVLEQVYPLIFEAISTALAEGEEVRIPGFATFKNVYKNERIGNNLQTGEKITVPAHYSPKCKFSKSIVDAVKAIEA